MKKLLIFLILLFISLTLPENAIAGNGGPYGHFEPTTCGTEGIMTAFGCIETRPMDFLRSIRDIVVPMLGGIALLMMIIGAFFVLTSQGIPERLQRGKEIIAGALTGLLFIIFTWLLLNIITQDLLGLF